MDHMKPSTFFLAALLILLSSAAWSTQSSATNSENRPSERPIAGGLALIDLDRDDPTRKATYQGEQVLIRETESGWQAVVGIALDAETGKHELEVDGETLSFTVQEHDYRAQYITIAEEDMVSPPEHKLERIFAEQDEIRSAFRSREVEAQPRLDLHIPVADARVSAEFGVRRYINEQPRNPHNGLDLAAPTGTPIAAAEAGKVVEKGDYYFNGKSVFIDHGAGLVTMYCHMDEIDVAKGDWVERGEQIGTVGKTGRVTGAHLHFSVILNGNTVDPELFLEEAP
ncbi:peptidoglycan DD-metalloendopeptidase family protein [Halorhodospira halochloris]|nr:peptidoglycan DD-metalloendopeptidase family protein [Halorhodospira halochloris]